MMRGNSSINKCLVGKDNFEVTKKIFIFSEQSLFDDSLDDGNDDNNCSFDNISIPCPKRLPVYCRNWWKS